MGWDEPTPDNPNGGFDLGTLRLEIPYYGYGNTIVVAYADAESNGFVTPKGFMYKENVDGVVTMFAGQVPSTTRKGAGYYILSEGYGEFPYETCGWVRLNSSGGVVVDSDAGLNMFGKITLGSYPNTSMTQNDAIENTFRLFVTLLTAFYTSNHAWRIKVKSIGCANPSNPAHYTDASFLTVSLSSSLSNNTTYTYNPAYIQMIIYRSQVHRLLLLMVNLTLLLLFLMYQVENLLVLMGTFLYLHRV